tara:strand:+ start:486 stop:959 length:474 start_codon:yes stop_codon:yes gene_type:complete
MLSEARRFHHISKQLPALMPTASIGILPTAVVLRFRHRTNGINLSTHVQRRSITAAEGEVDSCTSAVGGRRRRIATGVSPEAPDISNHPIEGVTRAGFHAALAAELRNAVIHHEGLHGDGPPGIKNAEAKAGVVLGQPFLGIEEALNHPLAQLKGVP